MPETPQKDDEDLRRRVAAFEQRIAELEERNAELERRNAELERRAAEPGLSVDAPRSMPLAANQSESLLRALVDHAPMPIYAKDLSGRYILASRNAVEMAGQRSGGLLGKTDFEAFPPEVAQMLVENDREILKAREPKLYDETVTYGDGLVHLYSIKFPLFDAEGNVSGVCGISADITERRKAQEEIRKLQEEMIHVQEAALRALSTPLIPIARGVLVMPLVGDVDRSRVHQVLEALLEGVVRSRARVALLDVTGVQSAGPDVADGLLQAARATRLLGAQVVLTGVQPSLAQLLAGLGDGLSGIVVRGTLESGIAYAMAARDR
jgi:rsbT co-antagonist protein RsbR